VEDYYSVLGLDAGASPDSIRIAYRRLARETHPDRFASSSDSEKSEVAVRMVRLNEAYAVLSDAKRRREYDESLRVQKILTPRSSSTTGDSKSEMRSSSTGTQKVRSRPRTGDDAAVVSQFSSHLREGLLSHEKTFSWKKMEAEGFDWGLEASFWSSHYCVALRGFAEVNADSMKKFINYAQILIAKCNRHLKKSYFLFLIPFQRLTEWDSVSVQCQRFVTDDGKKGFSPAPAGILLLDMQHSRTLRFGHKVSDKRFQQLLERVGTPS
jgi:DnaJ-domain-containing protein 1